jgi:hypothetical protein
MVLLSVMLLSVVVGCGSDQGATSADCGAEAIRRDGTVYTEAGFTTKHPFTASGQAERAECQDVGLNAPGTVFPGDGEKVEVVTFAPYEASQVLGVRESNTTRVFVAEGVASQPVMKALGEDAG